MAERSELDKYLAQHIVGGKITVELPDVALDDLRYLSDQAARGRRMAIGSMIAWMRQKHDVSVSQSGLYDAMIGAGIKPWFSRR
jgi:hypothetical protein